MSLTGAFTRTGARRAPALRNYAPDKIKWWKKKGANDGEIIRHLSPHDIHPIGPWLKTFPKKTIDRAPTYIMWPGGCALVTYGIISLTAGAAHAESFAHRY